MRGSQFANVSVAQAVIAERDFKTHQKTVEAIRPAIVAEDQINDQILLFNSYSKKQHLKQKFSTRQKLAKEQSENEKMLNVF